MLRARVICGVGLLACLSGCAIAFLPPTTQVPRQAGMRDRSSSGMLVAPARGSALASTAIPVTGGPSQPAGVEVVPEGHRGLHDFLYGDDKEAHGASSPAAQQATLPSFTREATHSVSSWLEQFGTSKLAGVYAVLDSSSATRFVGITRNVALALKNHLQSKGPEVVASVQIQGFGFPKKEEMAAFQSQWLSELSTVPEGNDGASGSSSGWVTSIREAAAVSMSAEERARYEDVKVKLRTAMADPKLIDELEQLEDDTTGRRERLMQAVETSDWSPVIEAQTRQTFQAADGGSAPAPSQEAAVVSPFSGEQQQDGSSQKQQGGGPSSPPPSGDDEFMELTPANVDKVLDAVRPYLISDGGNIEVVSVDSTAREIYLRLQGACGSCPSSTVTMKMGVERVLREKFKDLAKVEAVNPEPAVAAGNAVEQAAALKAAVEAKLQEILPAIRGLGGVAAVEGVSPAGEVVLLFRGPEKVRLGLEYAVKSLKGVTSVSSKPPEQ